MKQPSLRIACFAEFFGALFFLSIGFASVAALVLGLSNINYPWMAVCWGGGITLAIYAIGGISGAHMNPAVTISLAVWGIFDKKKVLPYILSQIAGGFCAAALVYLCFRNQILSYEATNGMVRGAASGLGSAGLFITSPASGVSMATAALVEAFITFLLVLVVFATTDAKNSAAPGVGLPAVAIGAIVTFCGIAFGPLTCFAMNPARDFGPRLFTLVAGWGTSVFANNFYWLLVPILATIVGGLAAGALYTKVICRGLAEHCPPEGTVACEECNENACPVDRSTNAN